MVCGNFILPEPASYVFFCAVFNLRNLLDLIKDGTQRLTRRNRGGVSDGGGITTLGAFRTFTNIPGPGIRTASFAAFGSWSETLLKNAESLRSSDALMRVAVPKASRPRWAA